MLSGAEELDLLPCAVILTDTHGRILFINHWARSTFVSQNNKVPQRLDDLLPRAGQIFLQTHIFPLLRKEGQVSEIFLQMKGFDEVVLPILLNAQSSQFNNAACYRWVCLPAKHRSEFEQKLLQSRQQVQAYAQDVEAVRHMLQSVLDGVKDIGIIALSCDAIIQFANVGAEVIFRTSAQRLVESNLKDWLELPSEMAEVFLSNANGGATEQLSEPLELETVLSIATGQQIHVRLRLRKLAGKRATDTLNYILLITDIQKQKQYERLQDEFIATISHELKTPLTSILGALKLLTTDRISALPPQIKKLIELTFANTERLKYLIADILDYSKLNAGCMSFYIESVYINDLIFRAIEEQRHYLPQKQIKIEFNPSISTLIVKTDPNRFLQLISNLLSNAQKFSANNSVVNITLDLSGDEVIVAVIDQGPGVSEEFLPFLFTQFRQQNSTTSREHEGSGLGLSICKRLAEGMDGRIGYQPNPKGGSIFWFSVPLVFKPDDNN